jgi:hemerythrin-like domain-containing protein
MEWNGRFPGIISKGGIMKRQKTMLRRRFLQAATLIGGGALAARPVSFGAEKDRDQTGGEEEEVSPAEDLMREHGVLKRVLLVYREGLRRLAAGQELPLETIADGAKIIRDFIEDYHEKLEEDFLFPRFRRAQKLVELVEVLAQQHQGGRRLTEAVLRITTGRALKDAAERAQLAGALEKFIRMYEPHEAREDTILFPALHKIVTQHEYDALGEDFEKKEHQLFGEDGFEKMVERVAGIEKKLGIYDLAQFTPKG